MTYHEIIELVGKTVEGIGVAIVVLGSLGALVRYALRSMARGATGEEEYRGVRRQLGRAILLGLEFLVAGDIIRTVTATPSFASVAVLAVIVLIRIVLSLTLEVEIEGRWPWQRGGEASPPA